jgi:peroxiredoxin Q/BCP
VIADFPADTVVIGASADKMADQESFTKKNDLPYPLLCDTDLKLIKELGIKMPTANFAQRVTFVVDKDGKIAKIYEKVTPGTHPKEVVAFAKELAGKK